MRSNEAATQKSQALNSDSRFAMKPIFFALLTTFLFGAFAFQLWFHATRTSVTVDEPIHILAGHRYWQCGDFGINPEHPPLLKLLATTPLFFRTLIEPNENCGSKITDQTEAEQAGVLFLTANGIDRTVIPARLSAALLSLLLAVLVFSAAWEMFGRGTALLALALLAFEPNLIAHGSLVTTDMALTTMAFAAVYTLFRYLNKPNFFNLATAATAVGLMLASKHSAIIFVPILFALLLADALIFRRPKSFSAEDFLRRIAAFGAIVLLGFVLLWAFYDFRYDSLPGKVESQISVANYIRGAGRPETADSLAAKIVILIGNWQLFPESYTFGLADVVATGSRNTFIFNRNYASGQWFYFPAAFVIKTSVALLLLLPFGIAMPFFNAEKRRETMFLLLPPLLFFAVALTSAMNIGVRHILPVYPFFVIVAAMGAVWASRKFPILRLIIVLLLLFHAATAVRIAPNYLAFANDFWGGSDQTFQLLADSNVEWGQNLKLVNQYLADKNITDCWFAGFGNGELNRVSQPCRLLPGSLSWFATEQIIEPTPPTIEGTILLSSSVLPPRGDDEYLSIAQTQPIAQIGGSIFVYQGRFEIPLAAALSRAGRASWLIERARFTEAVDEGRQAVNVAPNDVRTHFPLAIALARNGQIFEARHEFELIIELARANPVKYRNFELRAWQEIGLLEKVE